MLLSWLGCHCVQAHCEAYNAIKKLPIGKDLKVGANPADV
jgi:hypothetical protein